MSAVEFIEKVYLNTDDRIREPLWVCLMAHAEEIADLVISGPPSSQRQMNRNEIRGRIVALLKRIATKLEEGK